VSGEVTAVNDELADNPQTVNDAPEAGGWFVRVKVANPAEVDTLMDRDAYEAFLRTL
jgi:glycine cleavage system H protein